MMDEIELRKILHGHMKEICHFSQMQVFATSTYQKNYFQLQIDDAIDDLIGAILNDSSKTVEEQSLAYDRQDTGQQLEEIVPQAPPYEDRRLLQDNQEQMQFVVIEQVNQGSTQTEGIGQRNQEQIKEIEGSGEEQTVGEVPNEDIPLREVTLDELIDADGTGGKPAYVAVNGIVYDVTNAIRWAGGRHFGVYPGRDLTEDFMNCHNGVLEILKILPKVGTLKQ